MGYIDSRIGIVEKAAETAQQRIERFVRQQVLMLEINEGYLDPTQDFTERLLRIEQGINKILTGKEYANKIDLFLVSFAEIQNRTITLTSTINDLEVAVKALEPSRKYVYDRAAFNLIQGTKAAYIEPLRYSLMQQITSGASINDVRDNLHKWSAGELRPITGEAIPSLSQYATQIARDSAHAVSRTTNEIIKDEYELNGFRYVGTVKKSTRDLCRYILEELDGRVRYDELDDLIAEFPSGLYPETDAENFTSRCGGYNCTHEAIPIRM